MCYACALHAKTLRVEMKKKNCGKNLLPINSLLISEICDFHQLAVVFLPTQISISFVRWQKHKEKYNIRTLMFVRFCKCKDCVLFPSLIFPSLIFSSGESRIIFLPERSSICQYPSKISAINIKKQSRARLLLAHPVLYILKIKKTYGTF